MNEPVCLTAAAVFDMLPSALFIFSQESKEHIREHWISPLGDGAPRLTKLWQLMPLCCACKLHMDKMMG